MVLVRKDVLKPGKYFKGGREHTVTREDLSAFVENFRSMRDANIRVAVPWEHPKGDDGEAYPAVYDEEVARRERSRLNAGWVKDLFLDGDTLTVEADLKDDAAASLQQIGGFVSPQFGTFVDGKGRRWDRAISHIALTTRPVNLDQSERFELVQFSLEDLEGDGMDDELEKSPDAQAEAEKPESSLPDPPAEDAAEKDLWPEIRTELSALGIMVPDTVKITGDLDALLAAIASSRASRDSERAEVETEKPAEKPEAEEEKDTVPSDVKEEQTTVSMSVDLLMNELTKSRRDGYVARVEGLAKSGRISTQNADLLKNAVSSYQFSVGDKSSERDLEFKLKVYEELPEGAFWSDEEKLASFSVKEHRNGSFFTADGEISDERAEELLNELHPA